MQDKRSWKPDADSGISINWIEANGLQFEVAQAGEGDGSGDKLALCLHGFPELHYSWRYQIPLLADMGYRVWAPNLRGYGGSSCPPNIRDYALDNLCKDVAALIDASGAKQVTLIAHDWGAIIAWAFAIQNLRPLYRLIIMNVPHPKVAEREIKKFRQLWRSWYILFFQTPRIPEWLLRIRNGAIIKRSFSVMAVDKSRFPDSELQIYADAALRPSRLTGMINFYRALLKYRDTINIEHGHIDIPTLMIWGEEDSALNIHCTEGTEQWVPNIELHRLSNVSHWVQQEAPEKVNAILTRWLKN